MRLARVWFRLSLLLGSLACAFGVPIAPPDRAVLLDLKRTTTSATDEKLQSWVAANDCNRWYGVTCNSQGYVTKLELSYTKLTGSIPSSLANLTNLLILDLSWNSLKGSIPPSLGNFKKLLYLILGQNQLTGSIPPSLGKLTNLQQMLLNFNRLTGSIPPSLGNLRNLYLMGLDSNQLTGSIPPSLGNLKSLQQMNLENNKLTGTMPATFGNLQFLSRLSVGNNDLSGHAILSFSSQMYSLYLENTFISGPLDVPNSLLTNGRCDSFKLSLYGTCLQLTQAVLRSCFSFKPNAECQNFCNALQPLGACGGHGTCLLNSTTKTRYCKCDPGYKNANSTTCVFASPASPGLVFPHQFGLGAYLSKRFRHLTAGFLNERSGPNWSTASAWNWADELQGWRVQDQNACGACWAFASVAAMEAAYAITYAKQSPTLLSPQHLLDCVEPGSCAGGWPGAALDYAATTNVAPLSAYPYKGVSQSKPCNATMSLGARIAFYEEVSFSSWTGLLLAVQQQPVMVHIEASSPEFINYRGGVFSSPTCHSNGVDHTVLLVGYNLEADVPHWIIRNSWGPEWGVLGYMRLAITAGPGICGINTLPGTYPVVTKPNDPCNEVNYATTRSKNFKGGAPGSVGPCGGLRCIPKGASYTCNCSTPAWSTQFLAAKNKDGSETCVLAKPCNLFPTNPCGVGTCVNSIAGTYTCLCPVGYTEAKLTIDDSPTCTPGVVVKSQQFYTVPPGPGVACSLLYQMYGVPKAAFLKQNPSLSCSGGSLQAGVRVNVTSESANGCSLSYALAKTDTCTSVAKLFNIRSLHGVGSPNPDLDCSQRQPGQQVCIKRGPAPDLPLCTRPYVLKKGDTCRSIINSQLRGNVTAFFALNPGLYCDRLVSKIESARGAPVQQVCLASVDRGSFTKACSLRGKLEKVAKGEACPHIYRRYFGGKRSAFLQANQQIACEDMMLVEGSQFCV